MGRPHRHRGLRELSHFRPGNRAIGRLVTAAAVCVIVARPVIAIATTAEFRADWQRPTFIEELERRRGDHVVIVRYGADHSPRAELVWNEADMRATVRSSSPSGIVRSGCSRWTSPDAPMRLTQYANLPEDELPLLLREG